MNFYSRIILTHKKFKQQTDNFSDQDRQSAHSDRLSKQRPSQCGARGKRGYRERHMEYNDFK